VVISVNVVNKVIVKVVPMAIKGDSLLPSLLLPLLLLDTVDRLVEVEHCRMRKQSQMNPKTSG